MGNVIHFQAYDHHVETPIYRRNLPHWRQAGCTYFVTFRLRDSIPASILREWQETRRNWLAAHGVQEHLVDEEWKRRYQLISASERRMFERQQARQLHLELDRCHGSCLLRMAETRALVESALRFFDGRRCGCGDFTIMPNHVHWLVQPYAEYDLEQLLQSIKRYSATRVARDVRKAGKFWQKENYDRIVRDRRVLNAFRRYIADNPKNAGLADGEYSFFQAEWSEA